jgi:photosystem II stability/assembly factor-like uncharacterized protein
MPIPYRLIQQGTLGWWLGCLGLLVAAPALAGPWDGLGPGGGGAFTAIGAGPTGILICGADLSGAYRSLDHGLTWDRIGSDRGLKRTHVSAVGFDPVDPMVIHLGTDAGIYRSIDSGQSFTQTVTTGYIGAIAPAPSDPTIVYATYHPAFDSSATSIYQSTDRGATWSPLGATLPAGLRLLKLAVSPTNPSTLYVVSGEDLFVAGTCAVFRSVDGGLSWTRIAESLGNLWDLALDPVTPGTLYVTAYTGSPPGIWSGAVHKSTDGGDTWTEKVAHTGAILVRRDQPQTVRVIDVRRNKEEPESGVWESLDGGETWLRKSMMIGWDPGWTTINRAYGGCAYGMPKALGQDLSDPDAILWVSWQFAFASHDGGGSFTNLNATQVQPGRWRSRGLDNVNITSVAFSEAAPGQVYVGYHDVGFWRSQDGGASWECGNPPDLTGTWKGFGGYTTSIVPDPERAGVVWATIGNKEDSLTVVKSLESGAAASWLTSSGLPKGCLRGMSLDRRSPVNARTLFVTADGDVYRSQDDGATWSLTLDTDSCRSTAVDRFNGSLVYAGGEGGLWRSLAGGAPGSWARVGPPEFSGVNTRVFAQERWEGVHHVVADHRPGWAYVAAYGPGRGLYRTTDMGATWTKLLSATYLRDVAPDPVDADVVYAAASRVFQTGGNVSGSEGLMRSQDGGQTWTSLNDGLPWPFAARIAIDPANHLRLVLGSPGGGFFERTLPGVPVGVEPPVVPGGVSLSGAFPDPSRGKVSFTLRIPRAARVGISVHDLRGRQVWADSVTLPAGAATLAWDPERVAGARPGNGIYFARFEVERQVVTRRFALVR